jgi:hypothetical protein
MFREWSLENARHWIRQNLLWNFARQSEIGRALQCKGGNLDPKQFVAPFPGSSVVNTVITTPAPEPTPPAVASQPTAPPAATLPADGSPKGMGGLSKVLLSLLLAGGVGTGAYCIPKDKPAVAPAAPIVTPDTPAPVNSTWEREWSVGPDGKIVYGPWKKKG